MSCWFVLRRLNFRVLLNVIDQFIHLREREGRAGIGGAVINGDPARLGVIQVRTRERHIRHKAGCLIQASPA